MCHKFFRLLLFAPWLWERSFHLAHIFWRTELSHSLHLSFIFSWIDRVHSGFPQAEWYWGRSQCLPGHWVVLRLRWAHKVSLSALSWVRWGINHLSMTMHCVSTNRELLTLLSHWWLFVVCCLHHWFVYGKPICSCHPCLLTFKIFRPLFLQYVHIYEFCHCGLLWFCCLGWVESFGLWWNHMVSMLLWQFPWCCC